MNRWLMIGSLAALLVGTTGCLHHNLTGGCSSGSCASGGCSTGTCDHGGASCGGGMLSKLKCGGCGVSGCSICSGVLGKLGGICGMCGGKGGCRTGCVAGALGWQQGGLDYSSHLQPGLLGHDAPSALNSRGYGNQYGQGGPPSAQVGYPYYTVRGPRDFLMENPPTIGR